MPGRIADTEFMPDFTGRMVVNGSSGRFHLLEKLGVGAYGKVYRAIEMSSPSKRVLAVKCLAKKSPSDHHLLLQTREFHNHKVVADHPNVITFYEHFTQGYFVYAVMDLCLGGDLFLAITEKQIFRGNDQLIKRVFLRIIDAVEWCHDKGVFHRDLKPENILCSEDGRDVRLIDFGLSIMSEISDEIGCGSSYYMSPECIGDDTGRGRYSTRRNDIWSLGVILTNMITHRNPWMMAYHKDDCYASYLREPDFLFEALAITEEVNVVLKAIFTINPLRRITIGDLRSAIIAIDVFCAESDPRAYGIPARNAEHPVVIMETLPVPSCFARRESDSVEERYLWPSPEVRLVSPRPPMCFQPDAILQSTTSYDPMYQPSPRLVVRNGADPTSSSGPETANPITTSNRNSDVEVTIDITDVGSLPAPTGASLGPLLDYIVVGSAKTMLSGTPDRSHSFEIVDRAPGVGSELSLPESGKLKTSRSQKAKRVIISTYQRFKSGFSARSSS